MILSPRIRRVNLFVFFLLPKFDKNREKQYIATHIHGTYKHSHTQNTLLVAVNRAAKKRMREKHTLLELIQYLRND